MKLASWNVNGIRACAKKGLLDWLNIENIDVVCLQETKAWPEQLTYDLTNLKTYESYWAKAEKKGYSGVAVYTKKKPLSVKIGIDIEKFDIEGRTIIVEYNNFYLINCYFPNGQEDHARVPYKLEYCKELTKFAGNLAKKSTKEIIICGDYNTAHNEIDLANPKQNLKSTGFLPIERAWIDEFIEQGYIDIFRKRHPNEGGHYTWWSYRAGARQRNVGWRIDYFFVSRKLENDVKEIYHQPNILGSDHCPVILQL